MLGWQSHSHPSPIPSNPKDGVHYGLDRFIEAVSRNWQKPAEEIKQAVIDDLRRHIGEQKVFDGITLVGLKQK